MQPHPQRPIQPAPSSRSGARGYVQEQRSRHPQADLDQAEELDPNDVISVHSRPVDPEFDLTPPPTQREIPKNNRRTTWTILALCLALAFALFTAWALLRPAPEFTPMPDEDAQGMPKNEPKAPYP